MSKLTLHLQHKPEDWLDEFVDRCQGKLRYIKGVNCYPNIDGVRTIGRVFIDDNLSNELVRQGAAGVDQWIYLCRGEYEKHPWVYAWQGPNEFILDSLAITAPFNEFHVEFIERMAAMGLRVMAGNINVGWPRLRKFNDTPPYPPALRPTIEALVKHDGILGLHEYGPGDMRTGQGAYCLRYRNTVAELQQAGVPVPRIFIGETGIDVPDPSFPLDHHHRGWTEFASVDEYAEQLRWYAGELEQDAYVIGAAIFTVCNWDWLTFNVTQELAWKLAGVVAWEPVVLPVVPEPPEVKVVRLVQKLPVNPDVPYLTRPIDGITHTVIHHSGGRGDVANVKRHIKAIARYHIRKYDWPGIAYHFAVDQDGTLYQTTALTDVGYHSGKLMMNRRSVGVCLLGNFRKHDPPRRQLEAARQLCDWLGYEVVPHQDIVPTICPGKWRRWGKEITG